MRMQIEKVLNGKVLILTVVEPRIDGRNGIAIKEAVGRTVEEGHRCILLDLAKVSFIDSTGLGALVSALKMVGRDGQFAVAGLTDAVGSLFKLTRMDKVFTSFHAVSDGVAALNAVD
jgi:anti-sigma B factor antagonist